MRNELSRRTCAFLMCCGLFVAVCSQEIGADDWLGFRGLDRNGSSQQSDLPVRWDRDNNVRWKQEIAGRGWSSPIIWQDRIILTTAIGSTELESPKKGLYFGGNRTRPRTATHYWQVICLSKTSGQQLWKCEVANGQPKSAIHLKNSYASETPVTDGRHIYAYFGACGLFCLDMDGNLVWQKNPGQFETRDGWGTSSSPVVDDRHVYVLCDNDEQSFLVACNKNNGDEVWRQQRDEKSSWSSPFLWKNAQRTELVTSATDFARSYDPETGQLLWKLGGHSSIVIPTPVAGDDLLYLSSGFVMDSNRPIFAVRPGATGDISLSKGEKSSEDIAWKHSSAGPYNTSPLLYNGRLYVLLDRGFLACYDGKTGERVGRRKRISSKAGFTSSPWAYDGKIFCLNEDGVCYVFAADESLEQLHVNALDEMCMATPAISDGTLFIRTADHLYAIGKGQATARVAEKNDRAE